MPESNSEQDVRLHVRTELDSVVDSSFDDASSTHGCTQTRRHCLPHIHLGPGPDISPRASLPHFVDRKINPQRDLFMGQRAFARSTFDNEQPVHNVYGAVYTSTLWGSIAIARGLVSDVLIHILQWLLSSPSCPHPSLVIPSSLTPSVLLAVRLARRQFTNINHDFYDRAQGCETRVSGRPVQCVSPPIPPHYSAYIILFRCAAVKPQPSCIYVCQPRINHSSTVPPATGECQCSMGTLCVRPSVHRCRFLP